MEETQNDEILLRRCLLVKMMMRKVREQSKSARQELANGLKASGTSVTKKTVGYKLHCNRLKSCSVHKVPLLKKAHVQTQHSVFGG